MSGHRITADLLKADTVLPDPGNGGKLRAEAWVNVFELVHTTGSETRTLADPVKSGQQLIITLKTYGGSDEITVTADTTYNIANQTTLAFGAAEESILLFAIPNGTSGYKWCAGSSTTSLGDAPTFG